VDARADSNSFTNPVVRLDAVIARV
jgi:hypothetical protein